METTMYICLIETNDWEGETWHFHFPVAGNEDAIDQLRDLFETQDDESEMEEGGSFEFYHRQLTEAEVDLLCEMAIDDGYFNAHGKYKGTLDLPEELELKQLYKFGLREFGLEYDR